MGKIIVWTGGLIALYLAVTNAPGLARLIGAGRDSYTSGVKVLQGRG